MATTVSSRIYLKQKALAQNSLQRNDQINCIAELIISDWRVNIEFHSLGRSKTLVCGCNKSSPQRKGWERADGVCPTYQFDTGPFEVWVRQAKVKMIMINCYPCMYGWLASMSIDGRRHTGLVSLSWMEETNWYFFFGSFWCRLSVTLA